MSIVTKIISLAGSLLKMIKLTCLGILVLFLSCCRGDIQNLAKDPMKRTMVIGNNLDYFYRCFKPSTPREKVLEMMPPMNSDFQEMAVWVDPIDGESEKDVTGKPWRELIKNRDGFYIRFDEAGRVTGYITPISAGLAE